MRSPRQAAGAMVRAAAAFFALLAAPALGTPGVADHFFTAESFLADLRAAQRRGRGGGSAAPPPASPGPVVQLSDGAVQGYTDTANGADIFWSIPFGEPTSGKRRFAPPEPAAQWTGVLNATGPPSLCPQFHEGLVLEGSEDCLYLNVYRPQGVSADAQLPVMVWIYGGAFIFGDSYSQGDYDGRYLAQSQNVIVVTLNYRVNNLGFLALQSLFEAHGTAGNWGLLDQQLALKWVQRNIALLGGDPGRVLIFGQSAGGCSVVGQLSMPSSRGLFHAAIAESPIAGNSIMWSPWDNATAWGEIWASSIGCPQGPSQLDCLRELPLRKVLNSLLQLKEFYPGAAPGQLPQLIPAMAWWPAIDGTTLPASPHQLAAKGEIADVPIMLGTTENEGSIFIPLIGFIVGNGTRYPLKDDHLKKAFDHFFPAEVSDAILKEYPLSSAGLPFDPFRPTRVASRVLRDWFFTCNGRRFLRLVNSAQRTAPTYMYHFVYPIGGADGAVLGDYHACEIPFVYNHPSSDWDAGKRRLAAEMGTYWTALARRARSSSPLIAVNCTAPAAAADCISWPEYTVDKQARGNNGYMVIDSKLNIQQGLFDDTCDFWDGVGYDGVHP